MLRISGTFLVSLTSSVRRRTFFCCCGHRKLLTRRGFYISASRLRDVASQSLEYRIVCEQLGVAWSPSMTSATSSSSSHGSVLTVVVILALAARSSPRRVGGGGWKRWAKLARRERQLAAAELRLHGCCRRYVQHSYTLREVNTWSCCIADFHFHNSKHLLDMAIVPYS
jgi:hypothetical protein